MTQKTNAARFLDQLGIRYKLREYEVDPDDLAAEAVATKIGLPPGQLFKTLVANGDRHGICMAAIPQKCKSGQNPVRNDACALLVRNDAVLEDSDDASRRMKEKCGSGGDGRSGSLLLEIYYIGRFAPGEMGQGRKNQCSASR
jgi:hypothetical protein